MSTDKSDVAAREHLASQVDLQENRRENFDRLADDREDVRPLVGVGHGRGER